MKKQQLMENELQILANQGDRALSDRIDIVEGSIPVVTPPDTSASISNLIDNSDYSFSDAAFTTAAVTPATAGDSNMRAYNWFRMQRATALLVADDARSLKSSGHSLFGGETADTPIWNKTDGWAELGETGATPWDIVCPLPNNFVTPGMRFYLQMLVRLRTSTALPGEINFFWEFFDNTNTAPLPDIIKGGTFTVTLATFGTAGATTRTYKLIVDTDAGDQVQTAATAIATANAAMSPTNGVRISWPAYPGFTTVSIYVTVGANSWLVGVVGDGSSSFLDTGQTLRSVTTVPTATGTVPRSYAQTRAGTFVPTLSWALYEFTIVIPSTYDFSKTTGKQWLRGGVIGLMGDSRQLQIDRIGIATGIGKWSISEGDRKALSLPSTSQTGSTQGPPAGGGGAPDGEGGPTCAVLCTPYLVVDANNANECHIDLESIHKGMYVRGMNGKANRVLDVKRDYAKVTVEVRAANGHGRRCSLSDRWITSPEDKDGTPICELNIGDTVMTVDGPSKIVKYCVLPGADVGIVSTTGDHIMCGGGAWQHNRKIDE